MPRRENKKPRIAILINDMHVSGGIQRVAANLVRELGQHYESLLLSVEPLKNPVFHEPGLDFRSLDFPRAANSRLGYILELSKAGLKLRKFVKDHQIDIVIAIWYDWSSIAALALPKSIKKIGCEHIAYGEATRLWRLMRKIAYRRLDAVVGLTQEDLPRLSQISRFACVIPNCVPLPPLTPIKQREKILLTVGHLIPRKGFDRLLWSLKRPLHELSDWKLVVLGGGEKGHIDWGYIDYLSTLVNLLQLNDKVEFHPATKNIEAWYRRASIYVMGSRQEGLPLVLIEAKAQGLPIISFNCPTGPKEIVRPNVDGFLIENDGEAFEEAAFALMTNEELRQRMSAAALEDVRNRFSVDAVTNQWRKLIDSLIDESRI
jgi:amylovoran biosynthesis glycosyltransferase AmsD